MVDVQTQRRLFQHGYINEPARQSLPLTRLYNSEYLHRSLKGLHSTPTHQCQLQSFQDRYDQPHWPAFLLTFGWKQTTESAIKLHQKGVFNDPTLKEPEKLLFAVGQRGSEPGRFDTPRGITVSSDGDIGVADTNNHRIQIFNSAGIVKVTMGSRGNSHAHFEFPHDIAAMPNGNYAVADTGNSRIQILRPKGQVRYIFPTKGQPYAIVCDDLYNIFTATDSRKIDIYLGKGGRFLRSFPLKSRDVTPKSPVPNVGLAIHPNRKNLLVSDPSTRTITTYDYDGGLLWSFQPRGALEGLSSLPTSSLWVSQQGDIVVGDALNHTIQVYDGETGGLLKVVLAPTDQLGALQAISGTPEGHLVVTEFAVNGSLHCLKIFRFLECNCHRRSKKDYSTPIGETN